MTSNTADLRGQISEGEDIVPYIEQHFRGGEDVLIPAGDFEWGHSPGGQSFSSDARLTCPDGEARFHHSDGHNLNWVIDAASSGVTVTVENITFKGVAGGSDSLRPRASSSGGHVVLNNVNRPDGSLTTHRGQNGLFIGRGHNGTVTLRNCYIEGFYDNGLYGSDRVNGGDGKIVLERCTFKDNNAGNIRLGGGGADEVYDCNIVVQSPNTTSHAARPIWIREHAENIHIEGCHIVSDYPYPITLHPNFDSGSAEIHDCVIENNSGRNVVEDTNADVTWYGGHITGSGSYNFGSGVYVAQNPCTGSGCDTPRDPDPVHMPVGDTPSPDPDPTHESDWRNGEGALVFNGGGSLQTEYDQPLEQPYTYVFVAQYDGADSANVNYLFGGADEQERAFVDMDFDGEMAMWAGEPGGIRLPTDEDPHVFIFQFDGANSVIRKDDTENSGDAGGNPQHGTTIGSSPFRTAGFEGWIAEMRVYDRALSRSERDELVDHFRDVYGL